MVFSDERCVSDDTAHEILYSVSLSEGLQKAGIRLATTELLSMDIPNDPKASRVKTELGRLPFFKKILYINERQIEVVINTRRVAVEGTEARLAKNRIAIALCDDILCKIGASKVQYPNADRRVRKTWWKFNITEHTTLSECKKTLKELVQETNKIALDEVLEICLAEHFPRDKKKFSKARETIEKLEAPYERLLSVLYLRLVWEGV